MNNQEKWDRRFVDLARHFSSFSKDISTKVGSIITDNKRRLISAGYNGLSLHTLDDPNILNNRTKKLEKIIHGEINSILFAKQDLENCQLYLWPFLSCSRCTSIIIQSGITRVVAPINNNERWAASIDMSKQMYSEAGVEVILLDGYFVDKNGWEMKPSPLIIE